MENNPVFLVVTPAFNSARFIDETILSVVTQKGDFRLRYHVQDGGSHDETVTKLKKWATLLASGAFPVMCKGVEFTFATEEDAGMYDAINRAFERLRPAGAEYMTYINSDDSLVTGALQFAAGVFDAHPEIAWLGGRPCEMNERGELMRIHEPQVFPSASLRAGLHDGRTMCFVMQEGTFWRSDLWRKAGGFRTSLRQAGDWDLWRRFAAETAFVTTDVVLAAHRRSDAQLTSEMSTYYRELDEVAERELRGVREAELARFLAWSQPSEDDRDQRYYGTILRFHPNSGKGGRGEWKPEQGAYPVPLNTDIAVTNGFTRPMLPATFASGFGPPCTPDPAVNLLAGFRVTRSGGTLRFHARREGLHRIFLRCRVYHRGLELRLANGSRTILRAELPVTVHDRDCLVIAESVFAPGENVISMSVSGPDQAKAPEIHVVSCEAMPTV